MLSNCPCLCLPPRFIGKGPLGPDVSKCAGSGRLICAPSGNSYYWLDRDHIIQEGINKSCNEKQHRKLICFFFFFLLWLYGNECLRTGWASSSSFILVLSERLRWSQSNFLAVLFSPQTTSCLISWSPARDPSSERLSGAFHLQKLPFFPPPLWLPGRKLSAGSLPEGVCVGMCVCFAAKGVLWRQQVGLWIPSPTRRQWGPRTGSSSC